MDPVLLGFDVLVGSLLIFASAFCIYAWKKDGIPTTHDDFNGFIVIHVFVCILAALFVGISYTLYLNR